MGFFDLQKTRLVRIFHRLEAANFHFGFSFLYGRERERKSGFIQCCMEGEVGWNDGRELIWKRSGVSISSKIKCEIVDESLFYGSFSSFFFSELVDTCRNKE
jgi:hypothetical protein